MKKQMKFAEAVCTYKAHRGKGLTHLYSAINHTSFLSS